MVSEFCKILFENDMQFIVMPNGEKIPGQIKSTVINSAGDDGICTAEIVLKIDISTKSIKIIK